MTQTSDTHQPDTQHETHCHAEWWTPGGWCTTGTFHLTVEETREIIERSGGRVIHIELTD